MSFLKQSLENAGQALDRTNLCLFEKLQPLEPSGGSLDNLCEKKELIRYQEQVEEQAERLSSELMVLHSELKREQVLTKPIINFSQTLNRYENVLNPFLTRGYYLCFVDVYIFC